jgi:hypothetical protein
MDFADALHLASRGESTKFATFDEKLVKRAKMLGMALGRLSFTLNTNLHVSPPHATPQPCRA